MKDAREDLIVAWQSFQPLRPPHILQGDIDALSRWDDGQTRNKGRSVFHPATSWSEYIDSPEFGAPDDARLHTALLPMPFIGNLSEARVFILMLNPGFGPHDYFGEYTVPEYRNALLANLRQDAQPDGFLFLDPRFSWHGGFRYWHSKLRKLIAAHSRTRRISYDEARRSIQRRIAAIELAPYHSEKFSVPNSVRKALRSAQLARAFAVQLAGRGDSLVIVARNSKEWNLNGLDHATNVVEYSPSAARAAHLTPESPGGRRILEFLEQV